MSIVGHCSADYSDGNFDVSIFGDYSDDGNFDFSIFGNYSDYGNFDVSTFGCYSDDSNFDVSTFGCYSDNSGNHLVHSIPCPRQSWIPTLKTEFDAFFHFGSHF